ncbi:MAG: MFS transporter [Prolixibacteraceae bacterium]|jgi:MFS family permease|nr:MFS transporter [Prolixibacteraceae bacterium]MBT6005434.1 MFS transporter [Prolixibacteraceae bacterium]MBT6763145.1 MFS transporter [Prolixibacteraceae bacterium]MBT7000200.1 MFS transporter [Prolixibacteraceae bacterium]MBT7393805.1 MFS transporter [Prolixibacteraceae bacterium]
MALTKKISNHNFRSFLWHATFLAFAKNFMDVDTIIPAMIVEAGGGAMHIGFLTAIMMGGSSFTQLFFAPYLSNKKYKKSYLLFAINTRVFALLGLGVLLFILTSGQQNYVLWFVFFFITLFSLAGAFANISYVDILGKSVNQDKRKSFFSTIQIISGVIVLSSAFLAKRVLDWKEYPVNYAFMFFIGAILLLIATAGFWNIKEVVPSRLKISGIKAFFNVLKTELKQNKKLGYFLGYINTQGIAISFLPFIILYAKETFNTQSSDTGIFLIYKVVGIVFVSVLVLLGAKKVKYNLLLYSNVFLSLSLVALALFINDGSLVKYIFVLGGIVFSLFTMSMNGLLLEVSGNENRALYTGFAGAGNILPAIFPLIGGAVISQFGFQSFFILFMVIIAMATFFIFKIDCKK